MKAVLQRAYGDLDVLEYGEAPAPTAGPGEVLVRVHAASMHPDIWHVMTGSPRVLRWMGAGLLRPKNPIPGTDLAGVVEALGEGVTRFKAGDAVFGEVVNGFQWKNGGTFAELAAVSADALALKPDTVSFEQAAAVCTSGLIGLRAVRDEGRLQPGHRVLINGAGGALGSLALQMAKALGAASVTAVDQGSKLEMLRGLGADHVIDYTQTNPLRAETRYDLILDVASTLDLDEAERRLTPQGLYVIIGHDHFDARAAGWLGSITKMMRLMWRARSDPHLPSGGKSTVKEDGLETLRAWMAEGKLQPFVDRSYPLEQVQDAMRAMLDGQVKGKGVLTPSG